uniref:Semaphorin 4A n=1 Tax=Anas platyrhynchos platyrhynchos TaxID=8840 RepID=A0A493THX1_ANAPP
GGRSCCHHIHPGRRWCRGVCSPPRRPLSSFYPLPGDPRRVLTRFSQENVSHYDIFLLGEGEEELYVGARDRVLALGLSASSPLSALFPPVQTECFNFIRVLVALNQTHLYVCGTYAFSPACTYIVSALGAGEGDSVELLQPFLDGKGQCPFDPQHTYTALLVDGELYAGTMNNFQGNEPIISRSLGSRTLLKTDAFLRWLSGERGAGSSLGRETADEFDFFERLLVPRVARVCKSDVGGDKVLQKKWTTFLKAQLVCSQPGRFPFNVIHHAFALPRRDGTPWAFCCPHRQAGRELNKERTGMGSEQGPGQATSQAHAAPSPGHPLHRLLRRHPPSAPGQLQPAPELRRVRAGTRPLLRLAHRPQLLPTHPGCQRGQVSLGTATGGGRTRVWGGGTSVLTLLSRPQ